MQRKLYWLLDYEFVRLAISQETPQPEKKLKVNSPLFKKLCSGDTQTCRRNYDRVDTYFTIDTTFFCAGNDFLEMEGDLNEHRIEFESFTQFKSKEYIENEINKNNEQEEEEDKRLPHTYFEKFQIADNTIKDKCKSDDYKNALIHLMMMYFQETPIEVNKHEDDFDEDNSRVIDQFLENYIITKNNEDRIPVSTFEKAYYKKMKVELPKIGIIIKQDLERGATRKKVCLFGVKQSLHLQLITKNSLIFLLSLQQHCLYNQ